MNEQENNLTMEQHFSVSAALQSINSFNQDQLKDYIKFLLINHYSSTNSYLNIMKSNWFDESKSIVPPNIFKSVEPECLFMGLYNDLVYDCEQNNVKLPIVDFVGNPKLNGQKMSIIYRLDGVMYTQSEQSVLINDSSGFTDWVKSNERCLKDLFKTIKLSIKQINEFDSVMVNGYWYNYLDTRQVFIVTEVIEFFENCHIYLDRYVRTFALSSIGLYNSSECSKYQRTINFGNMDTVNLFMTEQLQYRSDLNKQLLKFNGLPNLSGTIKWRSKHLHGGKWLVFCTM